MCIKLIIWQFNAAAPHRMPHEHSPGTEINAEVNMKRADIESIGIPKSILSPCFYGSAASMMFMCSRRSFLISFFFPSPHPSLFLATR